MIEIFDKDIPLWDIKIQQNKPNITPFIVQSSKPSSAIIICPGGGYTCKADHEGNPIAKWLNSMGISAFVLDYRVFPYLHPAPLLDVQRAIRYVRYNHQEFNINPDKIGILGFSAGGHLAASASVHFDAGKTSKDCDEIDKVSCRPYISVLCYPVITLGKYTHEGSKYSLLGENPSQELIDYMSAEKQVCENTPPAFIWHTAPDDCVPFKNSLLYAEALQAKGIPFEMHIFPRGGHGLGLRDDIPYVQRWAKLCEDWFREEHFI